MVAKSDATREQLRECYRENLEIVLESVHDLLADLSGKTSVTADHGELLGEREWPIPIRHYGHPEGVYIETRTKVPWHVIEGDERRSITKDRPFGYTADKGRLQLGFKFRMHHLHRRDGDWYLHASMRKVEEDETTKSVRVNDVELSD